MPHWGSLTQESAGLCGNIGTRGCWLLPQHAASFFNSTDTCAIWHIKDPTRIQHLCVFPKTGVPASLGHYDMINFLWCDFQQSFSLGGTECSVMPRARGSVFHAKVHQREGSDLPQQLASGLLVSWEKRTLVTLDTSPSYLNRYLSRNACDLQLAWSLWRHMSDPGR